MRTKVGLLLALLLPLSGSPVLAQSVDVDRLGTVDLGVR